MDATNIINIVRACIRPFITVSGWATGLGLTIWLVIRFVESLEVAMMVIGPIVGAIIAAVGYYTGSRTAEKKIPPEK